MDNITWSKKSSATHDNGERNMCWRKGLPTEIGNYLCTFADNPNSVPVNIFEIANKLFAFNMDMELAVEMDLIIAYMKLPKPYKPD